MQSMNMQLIFTLFGIVLLALMIPILYRITVGPTVIDRMFGVNVIGTKSTVMLIAIGNIFERVDMFVDLALAYALLNFIGSIASARFLHRRKRASPISERIAGEKGWL